MQKLTHEDLGRILRECAGEMESLTWNERLLDTTFADLGYDSIALLETAARIHQEYGIQVEDEAVANLKTPHAFLEHVNDVSSGLSQ